MNINDKRKSEKVILMEIQDGNSLKGLKVSRAAVLPYTVVKNKIRFLMAEDRKTGEITDLGGGVKKSECALGACLREFKEETNKIFGEFYDNYNNFSVDLAIIDKINSMSVLFVPLTIRQSKKTVELFERYNNPPNAEIAKLVWVTEENFIKLISNPNSKLWVKLREFYNTAFRYYNISDCLLKCTRNSLLVKKTCSQ